MSLRPVTISPPQEVEEFVGLALGIFFPLRVPDRIVDEYAPLVQGGRAGTVKTEGPEKGVAA